MGSSTSELDLQMSPSLDLGDSHADAAAAPASEMAGRVESMISSTLPEELRTSARSLLRAVVGRVAVPGHFDAFCCQAFSKPEWAAASSPIIAEMFEEDEDQLAEMARIPDLVIEMGSGEVGVTCLVAARWAARGETHRLSRLADAIVASHASRNACSVDIMLALAATLAITRFSRADQLYHAALPLATEEHQEALADARRWLAAGRVVCSVAQDERDFWDHRLRKPRTAWTWNSKEEREALDHLSECLLPDAEGADLFKAVLPGCWWDLAAKCAQQQEKLQQAAQKLAVAGAAESQAFPRAPVEQLAPAPGRSFREIQSHPQAGPLARFSVAWICGCIAMLFSLLLFPREYVIGVLDVLKPGQAAATPAEMEAWRKAELQKKAAELKEFQAQHDKAKTGGWKENEAVLTGKSTELPFDSQSYLQLLVWLHLDPPGNEEVRMNVCTQLLKRVKGNVISLWELLVYPGSANAGEIQKAAHAALEDPSFQWSEEEKKRLGMIAAGMGFRLAPVRANGQALHSES